MSFAQISPRDAHQRLGTDRPPRVLDVRQDFEFEDHRIHDALLIPLDQLEARIGELDPAEPTIVVCAKGGRSSAACQFLSQRGFHDLHNLTGGMGAWLDAGLPSASGPVGGTAAPDDGSTVERKRRGFFGRLFGG